MKKYLIFLFAFILIANISALNVKQNNGLDISHPVRLDDFPDSNIDCNISIFYPNNTVLVDYQPMTNDYEIHNYTLNSSQTSVLGVYMYDITCTNGAANKTESFEFEVTPSGFRGITEGEGIPLAGAMIAIIIISILFFVGAFKVQNNAFRIIFGGLSMLFIMIFVLFSLVVFTELLGNYSNVIEGYSTFWMVIKVIISVSVLGLILFSGWMALRLWQWKRGLLD